MGSLQNKSVSTAVGVALGAAALGGALAAGARCIQLVRTRAGRARVKVLKLEDGSEVRVLAQGGVFQSATYLGERWSEPVFEYIRAFDTMFEALPQMRAWYAHGIGRVLMLGGGGFSYPKALLAARDDVWMDVVEADPAIVQMARRWFYLDRLEQEVGPRLGICTEDARVYLERISLLIASDEDYSFADAIAYGEDFPGEPLFD